MEGGGDQVKRPHMAHFFKGTHEAAEVEDARQYARLTSEESVEIGLQLQRMAGVAHETIRRPDCPVRKGNWADRDPEED